MAIIQTVVAGGGTTPTGTKNITTNGTHDVAAYATADVQVPTTAPARYLEKFDDYIVSSRAVLSGYKSQSVINLSGIGTLPQNALSYAYTRETVSYTGEYPYTPSTSTLIGGLTDPYPFNNIDIVFSGYVGSGAFNHAFTGREGINSVKITTSNEMKLGSYCFAFTDVKEVELNGSGGSAGGNNRLTSTSFTFYYCKSLTRAKVNFINIYQYTESVFAGCENLETVDLDTVQYIGYASPSASYRDGRSFLSGTKIKKLSMPNLVSVSGDASYFADNCLDLEEVDFRNLLSIANSTCGYFFRGCSKLPTVKFQSLASCTGFTGCFQNCTLLQSLWFYKLRNIGGNSMNNMLSGCTNVTTHFPMALQANYASDARFTGGFGGTNTTVLFDLVTSLTGADSNTYTRSEKDSTSTATAWTYNDTLYYTSGVSDQTNGVHEPAVNDTIYSDAACTTAVTTISAIA